MAAAQRESSQYESPDNYGPSLSAMARRAPPRPRQLGSGSPSPPMIAIPPSMGNAGDTPPGTNSHGTPNSSEAGRQRSPSPSQASMSAFSAFSSPPQEPAHNFGAAVLGADSAYSQQRRRLLEILSRLHSTGIQGDIDLPQVAVIGSQSVGKSSLIESMSGINLPRDMETCTRCPTECKLEYNASEWSCTISLRYQFDENRRALAKIREERFGPVLTNKTMVESALRRAQRAILRPGISSQLFLDDRDLTTDGVAPLSFSENCVCIRITGPDVPDLYFYDLPGIIANVRDGGDPGDIAMVQKLAKTYIAKPQCVILLVISCETDFENQGAGRLALEHDRRGKRTVGVLTKPDRIEDPIKSGAKWLSTLQNQENRLGNGWFCVKLPDSFELAAKITWDESRRREELFFQQKEPWRGVDSEFRDRLGSKQLTQYLGNMLSKLVQERLPYIEKEIDTRLQDIYRRLKQLPPQTFTDPLVELMRLIMNFSRDVSRLVDGDYEEADQLGLLQGIRLHQNELRGGILRTAPKFCPWERRVQEDEIWVEEPAFLSADERSAFIERAGDILYLDEIMERAELSRGRELPGEFPYSFKSELIKASVRRWGGPMTSYFDCVAKLMSSHVTRLVDVHFGQYRHGGLYSAALSVVRDRLHKSGQDTEAKLDELLDTEAIPFTTNTHYYFDYREKFRAYFKDVFRQSNSQAPLASKLLSPSPGTVLSSEVEQARSLLFKAGFGSVQNADFLRLLPGHKLDPAIDIMAVVRAYFQVAYKRFTDEVPLTIDELLVRGFARHIHHALTTGLNGSNATRWLSEAPAVVQQRRELHATRDRLEAARDEIASFRLL